MRTAEITTAQNVIIEYELGLLKDRIMAFILDFIILLAAIFLLAFLFITAFGAGDAYGYFTYLVLLPVFFFYSLFWEVFNNGQSIGKMALSIRVVRVNGNKPDLSDYILRWSFRMIDIYLSVGSVAAILISSGEKNQRLGGLLSNTTVVKVNKSVPLRLADIVKISTRDQYEPKYPQVARLREEDMLVIKAVIERYRRLRNPAHRQVVIDLTAHMCEVLDIPPIKKKRLEFLKTLIKDYIVLTR
ncbi:MAG: RDD family protein [Salibacteraceae bacterium]